MKTIFNTDPTHDRHTWSITSRLAHVLFVAEKKYGGRNKDFTILGIEITSSTNPQIWFPYNSEYIVIQITAACLNDFDRAVFQVAHEVIHCLDPLKGQDATILEEGLATLFSFEYCNQNGHGQISTSGIQSYDDASQLVQQILNIDPNIIKKLRAHQSKLSLCDKNLIKQLNSDIPESIADELTRKFKRS